LRQGKITYPLYTALNLASKKQREYIKQSLGDKDLAPAAINKVVDILEDCGAKKASRDYLDQFFDQAFRALNELAISPNHKQLFTGVVEKYRI
jgi:geranylgeranyl pyrophosphate synthase